MITSAAEAAVFLSIEDVGVTALGWGTAIHKYRPRSPEEDTRATIPVYDITKRIHHLEGVRPVKNNEESRKNINNPPAYVHPGYPSNPRHEFRISKAVKIFPITCHIYWVRWPWRYSGKSSVFVSDFLECTPSVMSHRFR